MNQKIISFGVLFFVMTQLWSQSNVSSRIPLLGEKAPSFTAESTKGKINFPEDYGKKWKILFSHPADFTPVCTSELMELALMQQEFKDLNCELVVVSTDQLDRHEMWIKSIEAMASKDNKPVTISYPMIDDSKLAVGWKYGMITPSVDSRRAVRGVFIVDPNNVIQSISFLPKNVGRNMEEVKRDIIALQTAEKNTVLTPANWQPGEAVLLPYPQSVDYYDPNKEKDSGLYDIAGYMLYKKLDK
jgi:peroxiredoxin (alkyl hydroperoxide reductase subunit C)